MNTSTNIDEPISSELPDAVWKALIAEKLEEYEALKAINAKREAELKDKKHTYEILKLQVEGKQREVKYWQETNARLEAEQKQLQYEVDLENANLTTKCKERVRELKQAEEHNLKLKAIWESHKSEWESRPMAIKRRESKNQLLLTQFNLKMLKSETKYLTEINKIKKEVDWKRLQVAIINFANTSLERRKLEAELESIRDTNAELRDELALLKFENESKDEQIVDSSQFLLPPPRSRFKRKTKDISDTISISTVIWEDLMSMESSESEIEPGKSTNDRKVFDRKASFSSQKAISSEGNITNQNVRREKPGLNTSQQESVDNSFHQTPSNNTDTEVFTNEVQECSSTVHDDDINMRYIKSPPQRITRMEEEEEEELGGDLNNTMNFAMSINSESMDDLCGCSSSTILKYDSKIENPIQKFGSVSETDEGKKSQPVSRNNSSKPLNKESRPKEKETTNVPVVRSVENVTTKYHLFPKDRFLSQNDSLYPLHSQFALQDSPMVTQVKNNEDATESEMDLGVDYVSRSSKEDNMKNRCFSSISDMDTDFDGEASEVSDMITKKSGNFSPPSGHEVSAPIQGMSLFGNVTQNDFGQQPSFFGGNNDKPGFFFK